MTVTLIPYRTLHFRVPATLVLQVFRIILDNEISYSIERIDENAQIMHVVLSVDMSKGYQRDAVPAIERHIAE